MSRRDDLQKLIAVHQRHLQILKEQAAGYGPLNVPTYVVTQIQDREAEIDKLQVELEELDNSANPTPTISSGDHGKPQRAKHFDKQGYAPDPPKFLLRQPYEPEMIHIPAGDFLMGSDPDKDRFSKEDEWPQRTVYLPGYYIAKTPITNVQYQYFVRAAKYKPPSHWTANTSPARQKAHPVVYVSWEDAQAYCDWLHGITGTPYRLPTESEWEKAARGQDGRLYPWGNTLPDCRKAQYENCGRKTAPVGDRRTENRPYDLLDMSGNVWEWVDDWYAPGYYAHAPAENPPGPAEGQKKVLRGGSWYDAPVDLRAARRHSIKPDLKYETVGFRICYSEYVGHP